VAVGPAVEGGVTAYRVEIQVSLRDGLLDPQGHTAASALRALGFEGIQEVRIGKWIRIRLEAPSREAAQERARAMCERLLANPVTEDFILQRVEAVEAAAGSSGRG
jgi:phosphoribosylformylglycinamidine synthase